MPWKITDSWLNAAAQKEIVQEKQVKITNGGITTVVIREEVTWSKKEVMTNGRVLLDIMNEASSNLYLEALSAVEKQSEIVDAVEEVWTERKEE